MPKPAQNTVEIAATRNHIMDAIAGIMATSGIEALSMREIARQTNMTAANLYNYFNNKQHLFAATKQRGFQLLDAHTQCPANSDLTPRDQIKQILLGALNFARQWPGYWALLTHPPQTQEVKESIPLQALVSELKSETVSRMMGLFGEVLASYGVTVVPGEHPQDPPKIVDLPEGGFGPDTVWVRIIALLTHTHGLIDLYSRGLLSQFNVDVDPLAETLLEASIELLLPATTTAAQESPR